MKDRKLESIIAVQTFIILVLLCIVVWFISDRSYINQMRYDVNRDGRVDWEDIIEVQKIVVGSEDEYSNE